MIDPRALKQLGDDEGFRSLPYRDSLGHLTIGHGFLIDPKKKGAGFTEEESSMILKHRFERLLFEILPRRIPWILKLSDARRAVLVNMAYNLGVDGLLEFKKTLAAVKAGDWKAAALHMLESKWAEQVGERANRLAKQMETGEFPE